MNKLLIIFIIYIASITFFSCRKSDTAKKSTVIPPVNNVNEFTLTFNNKNYTASNSFTLDSLGNIAAITPANYFIQVSMGNYYNPANTTLCNISCNIGGSFQCNFDALSDSANSQLGIYTMLNSYYLIDSAAGNAVYTMDSSSNLTITESDSLWVAGTMNFDMVSSNNVHYPATGSFRISVRK